MEILKHLPQLEDQLSSIKSEADKEEYILTKEEEETILIHERKEIMRAKGAQMARLGLNSKQMEAKINEMLNVEKTLKIANSNKHQELWHQEQRRIEKEERIKALAELEARCDAKYMFRVMAATSLQAYGKKLIINEHNTHLITAVCYFLSKDPRFETELGYSFNKGILIRGTAGLGKTHLIKCVAENERYPIHVISMIEVTDELKENGDYVVNLEGSMMLYLDDVGTEEPIVNFYGNKIRWFKNLIELVYLKTSSYNKLLISTNNNFEELEGRYGFRIRSRMKEMFNIIDITGPDMRNNFLKQD